MRFGNRRDEAVAFNYRTAQSRSEDRNEAIAFAKKAWEGEAEEVEREMEDSKIDPTLWGIFMQALINKGRVKDLDEQTALWVRANEMTNASNEVMYGTLVDYGGGAWEEDLVAVGPDNPLFETKQDIQDTMEQLGTTLVFDLFKTENPRSKYAGRGRR